MPVASFADYQEKAKVFSSYPTHFALFQEGATADDPLLCVNLIYPALGLYDELTEFVEKLDQGAPQLEIEKELGDVAWYIAELHTLLGLTWAVSADWEWPTVEDYEKNVIQFNEAAHNLSSMLQMGRIAWPRGAHYTPSTSTPKSSAIQLRIAGKIAGVFKKAIREDAGRLVGDRLAAFVELVRASGQLFRPMCSDICTHPAVVLQGNLDKLSSRKDRGVLKGDGDNR